MSLNYTLQLEAIQKKIFSVDPKVDDTIFIEHKSLKPSTKMKVLSFIYCKTQQLKKIAQYPLFIFKKKHSNIQQENTVYDEAKHNLEKKVDHFLSNKNFQMIVKMRENGYQFTLEQIAAIDQLYLNFIINEDYDSIVMLHNAKFPLSINNYHYLFFTTHFQIYIHNYLVAKYASEHLSSKEIELADINISSKPYFKVNQHIGDIFYSFLSNAENKQNLFNNWLFLVDNYPIKNCYLDLTHIIVQPYYIFKYDFIPQLSLENYNLLIKNFVKLNESNDTIAKTILNELNINLEKHFNESTESLLKITKAIYIDKHIQDMTISQHLENSQFTTIEYLPESAKTILKNIENIYFDLSLKKDSILHNYYELEILIEKRIPEIVTKFLSIHPDYREDLKNRDNKNAKDLLHESLANIEQRFIEIQLEYNQDSLAFLNVSKNYTQSLLQH